MTRHLHRGFVVQGRSDDAAADTLAAWPQAEWRNDCGGAGLVIAFEDETAFSKTPPRARTWGRREHTPLVGGA